MTGAVSNLSNITELLRSNISIESTMQTYCNCGLAYDVLGLALFNMLISIIILIFYNINIREFRKIELADLSFFKWEKMSPEKRGAYLVDRLIIAILILNFCVLVYSIIRHLTGWV